MIDFSDAANKRLLEMKLESVANRWVADVVTGNPSLTKDFVINLMNIIQDPDLYDVPVDMHKYSGVKCPDPEAHNERTI